MGTTPTFADGLPIAVLIFAGDIILRIVIPAKSVFSLFLFLLLGSLLVASNPEAKTAQSSSHVAGHVHSVNVDNRSFTVRVGDARQTFSFDNKTIFTYGDHIASIKDLRVGNEVLVKALKGKASEVNGTEQVEGIIEQIDLTGGKLIVKIGDALKEVPFIFFMAVDSEGKPASVQQMKVGDSVFLNVNLAFAEKPQEKKKK